MDRSSEIDVATSWSGEIVDAIDNCKAMIVLLSPNSVESKNVVREVALAFEKNKKILPLDLEPVALTKDLQYHLAGIQRAPMTNIDAIIRALGKLGLEAIHAPTMKLIKETDSRKSLMILPFEDLSPTGDNQWFADGLAIELINALSPLKALRLSDQYATKDYRRYQGSLPNYAKEMSIRYFVQGAVRKFGDQIKISVTLLDIETGDHLWQDSHKGTMDDIFDIQEIVAGKVVDGLKLHLASEEKKKLTERGTENAQAYELYLKAIEYHSRQTSEGYRLAAHQLELAIELDPNYAHALRFKAFALYALYRGYERDPALLVEAEQLAKRAIEIKADLWVAYDALAHIYRMQGRVEEAEVMAKEYVRKAADDYYSHFGLGFFYTETGQLELAVAAFENALERNPGHLTTYLNLVSALEETHDIERMQRWSRLALPHYERRLRLVPDDELARVGYANLLEWSNQPELALEALVPLLGKNDLDGGSLYNMACLYGRLNDMPNALMSLRRSIAAGFRSIEHLKDFLNNEREGVATLKHTPEYCELNVLVEQIEVEQITKNHV